METNYTEEMLSRLQQIELTILKDFDDLCQKNNLSYFLCGGSAIGAVRHGGFIPWDDDIDVGMSRNDYDRFLEIASTEYADTYKIMNNIFNPDFPLMNTRWGLNGTKFVPLDFKNVKGDFGIFLDIFCFDNIPDDENMMKKQATRAWFWGKLLVLSGVSDPVIYVYGWKAKVMKFVLKIAHYVLRILHLKPRFFYKRAATYMLKYKNASTQRMAYMFDPQRYTSIILKSDIYPVKRMKFEDIEVSVPAKIEAYLSHRYGNYMKLPPEDKRHNHPPYILDFGRYGDKEN